MPAPFDDFSVFEHEHLVGISNGAEAMSDDEGRSPAQKLFQRFLNEPFSASVDRRGRLVEDQDLRVEQNGARMTFFFYRKWRIFFEFFFFSS